MKGRVAQSVERRSDKAKVLGSSPSMTTTLGFACELERGPRGAMEARRFPEPEVVGSIPTAGALESYLVGPPPCFRPRGAGGAN